MSKMEAWTKLRRAEDKFIALRANFLRGAQTPRKRLAVQRAAIIARRLADDFWTD